MYQLLRGVCQRKKRANSWNDCHSRIECLDSKSVIKNLLGFRAYNFQHVSLASGRAVFSSCGPDPSKAKKRLSAPRARSKLSRSTDIILATRQLAARGTRDGPCQPPGPAACCCTGNPHCLCLTSSCWLRLTGVRVSAHNSRHFLS
jgi:hypothetical protein